MSATSSGNDPQFISTDNLNLLLAGITNVYLRLRNGASLTNAKVYFQTTNSPTFVGNFVNFALVVSDPAFTTYTVNLTTHTRLDRHLEAAAIGFA